MFFMFGRWREGEGRARIPTEPAIVARFMYHMWAVSR